MKRPSARFAQCWSVYLAVGALPFAAAAAFCSGANGLARWTAVSKTAESITGDIELSPSQLVMMHRSYALTPVREIPKDRLNDAGKIVSSESPLDARLYRVKIPSKIRLRHDNDICGPNDADWLLVVENHDYGEQSLSLAFFTGKAEPNLDYYVAANGRQLCGTYGYYR